MSLGTDIVGLAVAAAVAVGSSIQFSQAFAELNDKTPLKTSWALLRASIRALVPVVVYKTNVHTMGDILRDYGFGQDADTALTPDQVKDMKKWLGWSLGWFFVMLGALVALVASLWAIGIDIYHIVHGS